MICSCFSKLKRKEDTKKWCTKAIDLNPNDFESLLSRGEIYLMEEDYEEGIIIIGTLFIFV